MRFFYRIFTPMKVRPIKIINTSSGGGKQLQIVPIKPDPVLKQEDSTQTPLSSENNDIDSQNYRNKEKLMANLQLQSKNNIPLPKPKKIKAHTEPEACVYEYEEPDKEEIKRFAEKRDREWALQKHLDEQQQETRHVSKKRKKNKHSKNESVYKKRKLHAEITSNEVLNKEESLKLKVKLTPHNGHKHKHHRNSQNNNNTSSELPQQPPKQQELSSKEKLLQMRAVRHKHVSNDEKAVQTTSNLTEKKDVAKETPKQETAAQKTCAEAEKKSTESKPTVLQVSKTPDVATLPGKTLRSDFSIKTTASKELSKSQPTVHLERSEQAEKQAQKTFLKSLPTNAEKYKTTNEKIPAIKTENTAKLATKIDALSKTTTNNKIQQQNMKALERKLANIKQQCTIETKNGVNQNQEKRVMYKPQIVKNQYPITGFTVSKVESGVKRKADNEEKTKDNRPSLEITLINPPTVKSSVENKPVTVKRPPPATIPLDRIKKTINFNKSGVSIIPKLPEKRDNIGALDLSSKPHKLMSSIATQEVKLLNGLTSSNNAAQKTAQVQTNNLSKTVPKSAATSSEPAVKSAVHMSNLQMLSKVATEHPTLLKPAAATQNSTTTTTSSVATNKPKPQMPNLQTLKIPSVPQQQTPNKNPNLAKIPKLNEIPKGQFRLLNPQVRNMRPNQNQSIRNIPNPSLLVRQQNQNRLNSMVTANNNNNNNQTAPVTVTTTTATKTVTETKEVSLLSVNKVTSVSSTTTTVVEKPAVVSTSSSEPEKKEQPSSSNPPVTQTVVSV